jgi:hypothetical protein
MGPAVTARSPEAHRRELGLMCVTHNITIVGPGELFYRACQEPFKVEEQEKGS